MNKYSECEKMSAVTKESQAIGEFLEWLSYEKGVFLAQEQEGEIWQYRYSTESLLAEFYQIDLKKVEEERQQMLEELRAK